MASTILLKDLPEEVYREVIKEQGKVKAHIGTQYSLSKTVVKMLKDYTRCRKENNFKSAEA
ncbi:MAG: hypothetical protein H0X33_14110 [Taibaiella sp.]|nr:hypothetical protein [Taibaiella sp.]